MTEKKHVREQIAFQQPARQRQGIAMGTRKRVVTTPHEIVAPSGWTALAERRQRHQRSAYKAPVEQPLVARTLAQTGVRASSGRMQAVRPRSQGQLTPIPRRSSRRQRRGRRGIWKVLALLGILLIAVVGSGFALTSSAFRIQQVNVLGTQNRALIQEIQHLGLQGQNIFLLNTDQLGRLISALPLVASADIERQWPNQVTVTVVERTPLLLWQTPRGTYSVDRTGMIMAPASETTGADRLQTVQDMRKGLPAGQFRPGARLDAALVTFAGQIFREVPQLTSVRNFTLRYESTIYVGVSGPGKQTVSQATFVLVSPAGWIAYLGGPEDSNPLENRLLELQQILNMAQRRQLDLASIDLRFGLNPAYTLKNQQ